MGFVCVNLLLEISCLLGCSSRDNSHPPLALALLLYVPVELVLPPAQLCPSSWTQEAGCISELAPSSFSSSSCTCSKLLLIVLVAALLPKRSVNLRHLYASFICIIYMHHLRVYQWMFAGTVCKQRVTWRTHTAWLRSGRDQSQVSTNADSLFEGLIAHSPSTPLHTRWFGTALNVADPPRKRRGSVVGLGGGLELSHSQLSLAALH